VDLFTFIAWTLLVFGAYKVGIYVERKMKAKQQALQAQADAEPDSERNR
jgi:hypothetical protein